MHTKWALKRLGRYLEGHQRVVYTYPFREAYGIDAYSDADWAVTHSTTGWLLVLAGAARDARYFHKPSTTANSMNWPMW